MADDTTVPNTDAPATDAQPTDVKVTQPADATGTNSGISDRTFTQADLDRIIKERLDQERDKASKAAAKAQADAEAKVLAEQGKYKELFEKQQADLLAAQAESKASATRLMQRDIAAKVNLPLPLAERLRGETEAEMEQDARDILAVLPKPTAPNINAGSGVGGAPQPGQLNDAEKKRIADKYGVDPRFVQ